jgi:PPP family 3-phenylpropionic acid transporter
MTLRLLLTWLLPGEMGIILAQLTQMGGYAIYAVASVYYVGSVISKKNVVKGQTYLGASNTLGCLIAYFVGGNLTELFGVESMLLTSLATAVAGTLIMFLSMQRVEKTAGVDE